MAFPWATETVVADQVLILRPGPGQVDCDASGSSTPVGKAATTSVRKLIRRWLVPTSRPPLAHQMS
jgi:hypothetical protein